MPQQLFRTRLHGGKASARLNTTGIYVPEESTRKRARRELGHKGRRREGDGALASATLTATNARVLGRHKVGAKVERLRLRSLRHRISRRPLLSSVL
eukprot:scaffold3502_cov350-Prasinococcus_capsulatus_cf.AAC.3